MSWIRRSLDSRRLPQIQVNYGFDSDEDFDDDDEMVAFITILYIHTYRFFVLNYYWPSHQRSCEQTTPVLIHMFLNTNYSAFSLPSSI